VTSNINYAAINENFPVAGQDNDTQVFRDNFDTIKTSFQTAQTEVTALQAATEGLALDAYDEVEAGVYGSNFNNRIIHSAVLQNSFERKFDGGNITAPLTIDYENGNYQVYRIGANTTIDFLNFPDDESVPSKNGKVTLELYGDGTARTVTFSTSGGTVIKKNATFPTTFTLTSAEAAAGAGNPVIIEVWKNKSDRLFLNYVGQFSS
jgi:hypothetical protein